MEKEYIIEELIRNNGYTKHILETEFSWVAFEEDIELQEKIIFDGDYILFKNEKLILYKR